MNTDLSSTRTCFRVAGTGITIDGNGHTITGDQAHDRYGVQIHNMYGASNITVKNLKITNFYDGIFIFESDNNTIINNEIYGNDAYGIFSQTSSGNTYQVLGVSKPTTRLLNFVTTPAKAARASTASTRPMTATARTATTAEEMLSVAVRTPHMRRGTTTLTVRETASSPRAADWTATTRTIATAFAMGPYFIPLKTAMPMVPHAPVRSAQLLRTAQQRLLTTPMERPTHTPLAARSRTTTPVLQETAPATY